MKQKDDILLDLEKIEVLFDGPEENLKAFLEELHPTEIAFILELLKEKKRHRIIHLLPIDIASEAISEMDPESHPEKLLESLENVKSKWLLIHTQHPFYEKNYKKFVIVNLTLPQTLKYKIKNFCL